MNPIEYLRMPSRFPITWLVIFGLLLGAPLSHALSLTCCAPADPAEAVETPARGDLPGDLSGDGADDCCCDPAPARGDEAPLNDEPSDGGCDCPLRCCTSAGSFGVQLPPEGVSLVPVACARAGASSPPVANATAPSLDLMRPPRS